jgi:hypothetical protein
VTTVTHGYSPGVSETAKEKTDRQLIELLNELRVTLPGAQVLLGFLFTAPFATRFGRASHLDKIVFFACLLITALGVVILMAPSVYHRIRWNEGGKEDVVRVGHVMFLVGTFLLATGMLCAMFLLGDVLFGTAAAIAGTVFLAVAVLATWYVLPLGRGREPEIRASE